MHMTEACLARPHVNMRLSGAESLSAESESPLVSVNDTVLMSSCADMKVKKLLFDETATVLLGGLN